MEEDLLNDIVDNECLKNFERTYHRQADLGAVDRETRFNYAWCLVRSRYSADIRKGIVLLEELFKTEPIENEKLKRDYLYYLAIGNARLKEYGTALDYIRAFLQIEPKNHQVRGLEQTIKKKMETDGLTGIAIAGGALLAVGGLVGLGLALAKGKK